MTVLKVCFISLIFFSVKGLFWTSLLHDHWSPSVSLLTEFDGHTPGTRVSSLLQLCFNGRLKTLAKSQDQR